MEETYTPRQPQDDLDADNKATDPVIQEENEDVDEVRTLSFFFARKRKDADPCAHTGHMLGVLGHRKKQVGL